MSDLTPRTEAHPVYPGGPDCQPNCPGPWSMYHDGYADGYERGEAEARNPEPIPHEACVTAYNESLTRTGRTIMWLGTVQRDAADAQAYRDRLRPEPIPDTPSLREALEIIAAPPVAAPDAIGITARNIARAALRAALAESGTE